MFAPTFFNEGSHKSERNQLEHGEDDEHAAYGHSKLPGLGRRHECSDGHCHQRETDDNRGQELESRSTLV